MDRNNIDKIAQTGDDRMLLAKLWDRINSGICKNIPVSTCFLSPRELEMARFLFGDVTGLHAFGGYEDAERRVLAYLPEYLEESCLYSEEAPIRCISASWHPSEVLTHRDLLGALMGLGISRDTVGDICIANNRCDFFVTNEIAPFILQNFISAGRTKLQVAEISLTDASIPEPETKEIRDTVASLRLDSILSSGYRIGRSLACQYITAGKVAIDGLPCEKPDKPVAEGSKISVRGLGKIRLRKVGSQTKKGRISITLDRYI